MLHDPTCRACRWLLQATARGALPVGSLTRRLALEPSLVFGGPLEKTSPSERMRRSGREMRE